MINFKNKKRILFYKLKNYLQKIYLIRNKFINFIFIYN